MPNTIVLSNIADAKTGFKRAVMSTAGYAYADAKDEVWSRSVCALIVQLSSTKL